MLAVVGTLYAVVLGFVTVVVWQQYDSTQAHVSVESASVGDTWHAAVGLPQNVRNPLRHDMTDFATAMVNDEWPQMRSGGFSKAADMLIMDSTTKVATFTPRTMGESNAQATILKQLSDLHDARQQRLAANAESAVSPIQWAVLLFTGALVVESCYLFGVKNRLGHLVMTGGIAAAITCMLVLICEVQFPFRSALGIPPSNWSGLLAHIHMMDRLPGPMSSMH